MSWRKIDLPQRGGFFFHIKMPFSDESCRLSRTRFHRINKLRFMPSSLPNTLTAARFLLAPIFFLMVISDVALWRQLSLIVFLIAALTDWYDGEIARRYGSVTNLGKFLDPLADKFLTSSAFIAFAVLGAVQWWMVIIIVVRDLLVTILRSLAESRKEHILTSKTAQWKTFIQMAVLYYLLLLLVGRDVSWVQQFMGSAVTVLLDATLLYILMLLVTGLTLWTGIQYVLDNRRFIYRLFHTSRELL
jgi:CDP-diacylglycerol---glycerol-3-phosphate 3-phosphatidyltransferase